MRAGGTGWALPTEQVTDFTSGDFGLFTCALNALGNPRFTDFKVTTAQQWAVGDRDALPGHEPGSASRRFQPVRRSRSPEALTGRTGPAPPGPA